ncbi:MAG: hypothetical protein HYV07_30805 [Deltaproteobacteria bacterium]|nr:hypothetical protein [Deltaproteobacteria bacterium]
MRVRTLGLASIAALFLSVGVARADEPDLETARRLVEVELRFGEGTEILETLAQRELPAEQKVEVYRLLGIAYVAKGAPEAAQGAFSAMLSLAPWMELDPRLSPKILEAFYKAKEKLVERPKLLDVTAELSGDAITWRGRIEDPSRLAAEILLHARRPLDVATPVESEGGIRFGPFVTSTVSVSAGGIFSTTLPAGPGEGELRIEYYLTARDSAGRVLAQAGALEAPSSLVVARLAQPVSSPVEPLGATPFVVPSSSTPELFERWWFWVGVGVVAVGAGVGVVMLSEPDTSAGTLTPIELD